MKTILFILSILSVTAFAGPKIEVLDLMHVKVDGADKGTVVDAIANVPDARAAVLDWLLTQEKKRNDETAAKQAEADKARTDATTKLAETLAQLDKLDTGTAAERKSVIATLRQTDKQRRRAEAQAKIAAAQKEFDDASQ